jgi:hypothetical protein
MTPNKRKFNLIDLMILVAFTALGAAWCVVDERAEQSRVDPVGSHNPFDLDSEPTPSDPAGPQAPDPAGALVAPPPLAIRISGYSEDLDVLLIAWELGLLALLARKPRPRLRRLVRSPGAAACITVLAFWLVSSVQTTTVWLLTLWGPLVGVELTLIHELRTCAVGLQAHAGAAIIATWLILWLSRATSFHRTWLDICGVVLGIGWILLLFERHLSWFLANLPA